MLSVEAIASVSLALSGEMEGVSHVLLGCFVLVATSHRNSKPAFGQRTCRMTRRFQCIAASMKAIALQVPWGPAPLLVLAVRVPFALRAIGQPLMEDAGAVQNSCGGHGQPW